jgi:hypothetical protein
MNKKSVAMMLCLLGVAGVYWIAQAGNLEPPGPPTSTMVTLQEIYDKLDECAGGGLCGVPKTGQTGCWDTDGNPLDCAGTGQDGEYQVGVSLERRFTDNGDGTVTDNLTGLIWLQDANCFGVRVWANALSDANTLADGSCGLTDGSVAGDWRMSNVRELPSLVDYGRLNPALPLGHPFFGVQSNFYWTSTSNRHSTTSAWFVSLFYGYVGYNGKSYAYYVWPVRGGQ